MKQEFQICLLSLLLLATSCYSKPSRPAVATRRVFALNGSKNKYISLLSGVKSIIVPKNYHSIVDLNSCTSAAWKSDTSLDALNQARNIIVIYQTIKNFKQYLIPEISKVCKVNFLASTFFERVWRHLRKNRKNLSIKNPIRKAKNRSIYDIFREFGGFKPNNQLANFKLKEQTVYNIFNSISRGFVMAKVKRGKQAVELREIIINSLNPLAVLSKLLHKRLSLLFKSELFRGITVSMECLSMQVEGIEKEKMKKRLQTFEMKLKKLNVNGVNLMSELVCNWKALKNLIFMFEDVKSNVKENNRFLAIGKAIGYLIRIIGIRSHEDSLVNKK